VLAQMAAPHSEAGFAVEKAEHSLRTDESNAETATSHRTLCHKTFLRMAQPQSMPFMSK
jgi:hypothetical protein